MGYLISKLTLNNLRNLSSIEESQYDTIYCAETNNLYQVDTTDTTTADNSLSVIVSVSGKRYKSKNKLGLEISPTYSGISSSIEKRLIIVTSDETNGNNTTFYLHDGTSKYWVITSKI